MLLLAPFDEFTRIVWDRYLYYPGFLLRDNYNNVDALANTGAEVLLLHGDQDTVISNRRSQRLADMLGEEKVHYIQVIGGTHGNLTSSREYLRALQTLLRTSDTAQEIHNP